MTVSGISQTTTATLPAQSPKSAMLTSDFQTFLKMLTVQIQNQDPMSPMQSTEFATQLATFASVEQQVRANEKLAGLSAQLGVSTMAQLSGWIGMEARVTAPVQFSGAPVMLAPNPPALTDKAELVVRDSAGKEVQRTVIPVSTAPIEWAGTDSLGDPLPGGAYTFEIEASAKGETLGVWPVEHYAIVREARGNASGGIDLVFDGGISIAAANATALRKPSGL